MTNYDRIRSMSVEELARIFNALAENDVCILPALDCCDVCEFRFICDMPEGEAKKWLLSEVEE